MHATMVHSSPTALAPDAGRLARIAGGIAVSLLLHALMLGVQRPPQPILAMAPAPPEPLTVRLRPPAPPMPAPAPATATPRREPAAAPVQRSRPVIAVAPAARQSKEETYALDPTPAAPPADKPAAETAPGFDLAAARSLARKFANEPDPARVGTALERLPPKPLETESRLARGIGAAKRANCKDGIPGGLLAPVYLMLEKKDSGCKW